MSLIEPEKSSSSLPLFTIIEKPENSSDINSNIENISLKPLEKHIKFEVKTDNFNRKIQIKTKQEDTICTTNKFCPTATCSTTNPSTSPKLVRIQKSPNSTSK